MMNGETRFSESVRRTRKTKLEHLAWRLNECRRSAELLELGEMVVKDGMDVSDVLVAIARIAIVYAEEIAPCSS